MTRSSRILLVLTILVTLGAASLAIALSHDSPCSAPQPNPPSAARMKAVMSRCYGAPDVLTLEEIAKPIPKDDEVLVRVHAAALNPLDWHYMRGKPWIMRLASGIGTPEDMRVGVDYAGTVEAVGKSVTRFKPGDAVFGAKGGALAEYVAVRESRTIVLKPSNLSFEQAAGVPIAAVTALQALRDKGHIQPGQKVLINGASGGVGTFAVQIAKSFGAEVTGVCSTRNVEMVRSIGADHVVDYKREDFTQSGQHYDLILDNVGNRSLSDVRRVLQPKGVLVMVGGQNDNPFLGPLTQSIKAQVVAPFVSQELAFFLSDMNVNDLQFLSGLLQAGKVTPVIDRFYPLSDAPRAMRYLEEGRARGKIIIKVVSE
jgi:NADPH:quinone reductase-like Zn-dependent oxidoreductase